MRTLTAGALAKVAQDLGTKPMILLEIEWADGNRVKYGDKTVGEYAGKIVDIDSVDEIVKVSDGSDSTQVSVVLDDTDGSIKSIIDTVDVHKRSCWVYQYFQGMSLSDKFLIFRGEVSSPITWDEGARTVSFDIVSKIEDNEVGFSIEEGQFPLLPPDLVGKPWPLVFGNCVNVPTLRITSPREGTLAEGFGIRDYTLEWRIALAEKICCPPIFISDYEISGTQGGVFTSQQEVVSVQSPFQGTGLSTNTIWTEMPPEEIIPDQLYKNPVQGPDADCEQNRCEQIEELTFQLQQQQEFEYNTVRIFGGNRFPQNKRITLSVGGAYIIGTFSGETFTIQERYHPDIISSGAYGRNATLEEILYVKFRDGRYRLNCDGYCFTREEALATFGSRGSIDAAIAVQYAEENDPERVISNCNRDGVREITDCQKLTLDSYNDFPAADLFWATPGSKITYAEDTDVVYIVNILPSDVKCVTAYRTLENGVRLLLVVPDDYYQVRTVDYVGYQVTELYFPVALSILGKGWEDDIYVTQESSVGPNTVDILEWLIETYTSSSIDATSFNAVKTKIQNYPSDFPLLDRRNVIQVLEEIAYQARCAIYLRDNTFYLKYLAEEPDPVDTIEEDDILQNTLRITHTPTEDLVTKLTAVWRDDYAKDEHNLILRNNVVKYGTQADQDEYYIYNRFPLVEKSATFWLIRKSNTWRKLQFKTALNKLALEPFDDITIDCPSFSASPVLGMIESATYDSSDNTISFEVWTSVRSGETVNYPWYFPATVEASQVWPPPEEYQVTIGPGTTPGSFVLAPPGHPLSATAGGVVTAACSSQPIEELEYCCNNVQFYVNNPEECGNYRPRRVDDDNDLFPPSLTLASCPGAINLSKEPRFLDGRQPKLKEIEKIAKRAEAKAAKATDIGQALGGGGAGGQRKRRDPDGTDEVFNPFEGSPKTITKTPPGCQVPTFTLFIAWFPIRSIELVGEKICVPAGCTRTETFEFAGSYENALAAMPPSEASAIINALLAQGPQTGPNTGLIQVSGEYHNAPCIHGGWSVLEIAGDCTVSAADEGKKLSYSIQMQNGEGDIVATAGLPSGFQEQEENFGDRGEGGTFVDTGGARKDSVLYPELCGAGDDSSPFPAPGL